MSHWHFIQIRSVLKDELNHGRVFTIILVALHLLNVIHHTIWNFNTFAATSVANPKMNETTAECVQVIQNRDKVTFRHHSHSSR